MAGLAVVRPKFVENASGEVGAPRSEIEPRLRRAAVARNHAAGTAWWALFDRSGPTPANDGRGRRVGDPPRPRGRRLAYGRPKSWPTRRARDPAPGSVRTWARLARDGRPRANHAHERGCASARSRDQRAPPPSSAESAPRAARARRRSPTRRRRAWFNSTGRALANSAPQAVRRRRGSREHRRRLGARAPSAVAAAATRSHAARARRRAARASREARERLERRGRARASVRHARRRARRWTTWRAAHLSFEGCRGEL